MTLNYDAAAARVTAPGERFETEEITLHGQQVLAFKNAPRSLREVFAASRNFGDQPFLVYEDERWTFTEVMAAKAMTHSG